MRRIFAAGLLLVVLYPLQGLALSYPPARVTVASGEIRNHDLELSYPNATRNNRITAFELSLSEALLAHWDGRIAIGYLDITQSANPLAAGQNLTGPYIGLGIRGRLLEAGPASVSLDTAYRYVQTEGVADDQEVELRWHEFDASLRLDWRLGPVPAIYVAGGVHSLRGEEIARGPVDRVLDIENRDDMIARAGLDFQVDPGGHIGVEVSGGSYRGFRLYFLRRF